MRCRMLWLTPPRVSLSADLASSYARRRISVAALRVKVSIMMRAGSTPWITRCATRWASVSVLPVPAPATISSGPDLKPFSGSGSPWVAARRWGPLSFAKCDAVDMTAGDYTESGDPLSLTGVTRSTYSSDARRLLDGSSLSYRSRRGTDRPEIAAAREKSQSDIALDGREIDRHERRIMDRHPAVIEVYAETDVGQNARTNGLAVLSRAAQAIDVEDQVSGGAGDGMGQEGDGDESAIRKLVAPGMQRFLKGSELLRQAARRMGKAEHPGEAMRGGACGRERQDEKMTQL